MDPSLGNVRCGFSDGELQLGVLRFESFPWELSLMNFHFGAVSGATARQRQLAIFPVVSLGHLLLGSLGFKSWAWHVSCWILLLGSSGWNLRFGGLEFTDTEAGWFDGSLRCRVRTQSKPSCAYSETRKLTSVANFFGFTE